MARISLLMLLQGTLLEFSLFPLTILLRARSCKEAGFGNTLKKMLENGERSSLHYIG